MVRTFNRGGIAKTKIWRVMSVVNWGTWYVAFGLPPAIRLQMWRWYSLMGWFASTCTHSRSVSETEMHYMRCVGCLPCCGRHTGEVRNEKTPKQKHKRYNRWYIQKRHQKRIRAHVWINAHSSSSQHARK